MKARKILVVDDEAAMVEFVRAVVENEHTRVVGARDGEAGVAAAKSELPDLIILDVQMPKLDGFGALAALKAEAATRDIPVIMLTGLAGKTGVKFSRADVGDFVGVAPQAYLDKPVEPAELLALVEGILSGQ